MQINNNFVSSFWSETSFIPTYNFAVKFFTHFHCKTKINILIKKKKQKKYIKHLTKHEKEPQDIYDTSPINYVRCEFQT